MPHAEAKNQNRTLKRKEDDDAIDMAAEELQINMYRIMFEDAGFPISRMQIMAIVRDGGTYIAESRGIGNNKKLSGSGAIRSNEGLS